MTWAGFVKTARGYDYPNDDCVVPNSHQGGSSPTANKYVAAESVKICESMCAEHSECRVADFNHDQKRCYMKTGYNLVSDHSSASTVYLKSKCGENSDCRAGQ